MRGRALAPAIAAPALAWAGGARAAPWSEPVLVAAAPRPAETVAVRIAGPEVAAAWTDYRVVGRGRGTSATDFAVWAAAGPLGGALGPARALDRGLERDPLPALATSASGWAALAWTHEGHVRLALRAPGGAFGAPVAIPSTMAVGQVGVGIDDAGTATVAWSDFVFGADSPVLATTVAAGGAPAPVQTLGDGTLTSAVALAVGARGRRRGGLGRARLDGAGGAAPIRRRLRDADHVRRSAGHGPRERRRHRFRRARHPRAAAPRGAAPRRGRRARAGDAGRRLERTLAASGQPFAVVAEEVEQPIARSVRSAFDTTETANDAALTGGGETLTVWSGSSRGVSIHPLTAGGGREPIESLVDDACATGGAEIAAGPGEQAAALFLHRSGVWIAYRAAGAPARPRRPRICSLAWVDATAVALHPRVRAGRVDLYLRVSKPIARLTVALRRGSTVAHRRLGPRPTGHVRVRLRGRGGAPRLTAGHYRVTVRAVDRAGRHAAARAVTLRVVRAPRVKRAG